jgi:hypothetical protein
MDAVDLQALRERRRPSLGVVPDPGTGVLFCDLVGSTELLTRLGNAASEQLRRRYFAAGMRRITLPTVAAPAPLGDERLEPYRSAKPFQT